jgi:hypothetical protein
LTHTTVSEGQRALAWASVENSFAPTGFGGVVGAGLAEVGGGPVLAGAAVGAGAGAAGAAVGAGAGAGGDAGAAVG